MHYSANRGLAIACSPSVCDVGLKCWKLIPNTFALRGPKAIHLRLWEHEEIWGD